MLYVIRVFENGGILVSDKKPQVVKSGLFAGITKLDGKRYQISSLKWMVSKQLNDPQLVEYANDYVNALKPGDTIVWASPSDEPVIITNEDGDRITLTRKWANVDINRAFAAIETHVNETVDAD